MIPESDANQVVFGNISSLHTKLFQGNVIPANDTVAAPAFYLCGALTLRERYRSQSLEFLVTVLENPGDYTEEAAIIAREELQMRRIPREDLVALARKLLSEKLRLYLDQFDVVNDSLELPESHFLNEEEVKIQFMAVFAQWKNERDDMIPDSWHYIIGAAFG